MFRYGQAFLARNRDSQLHFHFGMNDRAKGNETQVTAQILGVGIASLNRSPPLSILLLRNPDKQVVCATRKSIALVASLAGRPVRPKTRLVASASHGAKWV